MENLVDYARSVIEQVQVLPLGSAIRSSVALPGLSVRVSSFDKGMTDAVESNFIRRPLKPTILPDAHMDAFIVHPGIAGMPAPARWSGTEFYRPQRVAEILEAAGLQGSYYYDLDHWHLYDPKAGVAVQLMRDAGQYPPWETGAPLRPFLHWHYALRGMRLAHCGTLGVNGKGIILGGGGGSGKSGTVIAGLLNGLQSVGDDYVLLETGAELVAHPLFATLKQDPAGFQRLRLDRHVARDLPLNWQGKHQFTIGDLASAPVPASLKIGALLLPRVAGTTRTEISPVARAEAMISLAASSIYQMPGERESGFRFFGAVARQLPCFRLDLGSDPAEISATIGNFIERLAA